MKLKINKLYKYYGQPKMNVVKYITSNQTITLVTLAFFVCIGALGILSSEQGVCTSKGHGLFDYTSTHLLGNDCDSVWMFVVIMVLAVVIQIMRNIIWIKSSQATRQAMQEDKGHRQKITIVMYTCLLYTSPSPRDLSTHRMPSSA